MDFLPSENQPSDFPWRHTAARSFYQLSKGSADGRSPPAPRIWQASTPFGHESLRGAKADDASARLCAGLRPIGGLYLHPDHAQLGMCVWLSVRCSNPRDCYWTLWMIGSG